MMWGWIVGCGPSRPACVAFEDIAALVYSPRGIASVQARPRMLDRTATPKLRQEPAELSWSIARSPRANLSSFSRVGRKSDRGSTGGTEAMWRRTGWWWQVGCGLVVDRSA